MLQSTEGRIRLAVVPVVALIAATVLFTVALPAGAGNGGPSAGGVQPEEVDLGGQPNDCSATVTGRLPSAAAHELRIQNPQDGNTYNGVSGVSFSLTIDDDDELMDFTVIGAGVVFDVVVKGGSKSTHFDYDGNSGPGPVTSDQGLHAPTKGNGNNGPLFAISHVSFCYSEAVPLSGTVMFDANDDADLVADIPEEGRTVRAFAGSGEIASAVSGTDGTYVLYVPPSSGAVSVCEYTRTGYVQIGTYPASCSSFTGVEAGGHSVTVGAVGSSGLDFDNALESCGEVLEQTNAEYDVEVELFGDSDVPCAGKAGDAFLADGIVKVPIVGTGTVAGSFVIERSFDLGVSTFVPLQWSRFDDGTLVDLQYCSLRPKASGDGNQFDAYIGAGNYPSLAGVDYAGAEPDTACKVYELETSAGVQTTVGYFMEDPYFG